MVVDDENLIVLGNTFSVNMLPKDLKVVDVKFEKITQEEVKHLLEEGFTSIIGHEAIALLFTAVLNINVEKNRRNFMFSKGDTALIGSIGRRLTDDLLENKRLIDEMPVIWWRVSIV